MRFCVEGHAELGSAHCLYDDSTVGSPAYHDIFDYHEAARLCCRHACRHPPGCGRQHELHPGRGYMHFREGGPICKIPHKGAGDDEEARIWTSGPQPCPAMVRLRPGPSISASLRIAFGTMSRTQRSCGRAREMQGAGLLRRTCSWRRHGAGHTRHRDCSETWNWKRKRAFLVLGGGGHPVLA